MYMEFVVFRIKRSHRALSFPGQIMARNYKELGDFAYVTNSRTGGLTAA